MVEVLRVFRRDRARVACVGEQHFILGLDLAADYGAEVIHRVTGGRDVFRVDIVGRQVTFAAVNKAMACKVNQDAVVVFGHRRQPGVDFTAYIGERGFRAGQHVHILGFEVAALRTDQRGKDRLRIPLREEKLIGDLSLLSSGDQFLL